VLRYCYVRITLLPINLIERTGSVEAGVDARWEQDDGNRILFTLGPEQGRECEAIRIEVWEDNLLVDAIVGHAEVKITELWKSSSGKSWYDLFIDRTTIYL
jgi:hypothetical protein